MKSMVFIIVFMGILTWSMVVFALDDNLIDLPPAGSDSSNFRCGKVVSIWCLFSLHTIFPGYQIRHHFLYSSKFV